MKDALDYELSNKKVKVKETYVMPKRKLERKQSLPPVLTQEFLAKPNAIDPKQLRRKLDKDIKYV